MKTIINENQMGLLFRGGAFVKILGAGKYTTFGDKTIEVLPIDKEITPNGCPLQKLLDSAEAKDEMTEVTVKNGEICLHFADGCFEGALTAGRHAFWNARGSHGFRIYDTSEPKITDVAPTILGSLGAAFVTEINVPDGSTAVVSYDGKASEYLGEGRYFYWNGAVKISCRIYNMCVRELAITGQEILTKDKVGLRVNFTASWRITDFMKIAEEYGTIEQPLYTAAQLALRDHLGGKTMDELLAERENIGAELLEELKKRTVGMHVEILSAGIKDVILPGEIAAIMNSVLAAEKRAQANVITRREEVASTRSLLNTAKLMDENATLRRLKELEYIERICANVGEITVDARSSLLSQLAQMIGNDEK
ncbi:MAG: slipin family protein [Oscillospiraceae bacterium]|nr:slipin family protein [Oscillospiraceae bacterium]